MTCPKCGYDDELNDYVDDFLDAYGYHIIAAGRQVGKTEMIIQKATKDAHDGHDVCIIEPTHVMAEQVRDRVDECYGFGSHSGIIRVVSSSMRSDFDTTKYDVVLIDNAEAIPHETLLEAHRKKVVMGCLQYCILHIMVARS